MATTTKDTNDSLRFGIRLDEGERAALAQDAVRAQSEIRLMRQPGGKYVLRGEESGGSGKVVGHYVGYAQLADWPFAASERLTVLSRNTLHRWVFGSTLVRVEVFRYQENHVHTLISAHTVRPQLVGSPSRLMHRVLWQGKYGSLDDHRIATFPAPDGGPVQQVPSFLREAFQLALTGSRCRNCQHSHFERLKPLTLPVAVLSALQLGEHALAEATDDVATRNGPFSAQEAHV